MDLPEVVQYIGDSHLNYIVLTAAAKNRYVLLIFDSLRRGVTEILQGQSQQNSQISIAGKVVTYKVLIHHPIIPPGSEQHKLALSDP